MYMIDIDRGTLSDLLSSHDDTFLNPGIALCSRVRVWTMESIRSSRVRSDKMEGDLEKILKYEIP